MDVLPAGYDSALAQSLVSELQAEFTRVFGGPDRTPVDPAEFTPPGGLFLVGTEDGEPVACGAFRRYDAQTAELKRMFVREDSRGRGHARTMLAALEHAAASRGYTRLVLETGDLLSAAQALYETSGYEAIPSYGYYAGSPHNRCYARTLV